MSYDVRDPKKLSGRAGPGWGAASTATKDTGTSEGDGGVMHWMTRLAGSGVEQCRREEEGGGGDAFASGGEGVVGAGAAWTLASEGNRGRAGAC
jgi:hypothetical protein